MKKIILATVLVFSVVLFTSFIVTADAKPKKDHPKKGDEFAVEEIQEIEADEEASNMKPENPVKQLSHSGIIKGTVIFCDPDEENSNAGILVYIPGRSFFVKTGPDREFVLSYVPEGVYNLIIEIEGQDQYEISEVQVGKKMTTDLGNIIVAANPGALEICEDGKDNDCDLEIDEKDCIDCTDIDGDGFYEEDGCGEVLDNCPEIVNPNQLNSDGDEFGDACDSCIDVDGDEYGEGNTCLDSDCDDENIDINPGSTEICGDGIDNDCDGLVDTEDTINCGQEPPP